MRSNLVLVLTASFVLACGGSEPSTHDDDDGGTTPQGAHAERCALACEIPDGPCAGQDATSCSQDCVTVTEGLSDACALCIADNTGWAGLVCEGEDTCSFGPGDNFCDSEPTAPCQPSYEVCQGFQVGGPSDCAEVCN
jgi:hypothetical protein